MMKKTTFVRIMDGLRDYWDELGKDMDRLGVVFQENHLTKVFDNTLDTLYEDLEGDLDIDPDIGPWCYYFAFDLDWGRDKSSIGCATINEVEYSLTDAGMLYDFLMLLNEEG